jgi:stage II sporulation protein D
MQAILAGGRVGLVAAIVIAGLVPLRALAGPACDTTVRVLLGERNEDFELVSRGQSHSFEALHDGRMRVDGVVRKSWTSGPGRTTLAGRRVPGVLSVVPLRGGLSLIAEVPLEVYVAGVLTGEVPAGWEEQALRAQAVVSRSYGLHERALHARRAYHIKADTRNQVFKLGTPPEPFTRAVTATRCEVLTWRGAPILAVYHSASGGRTASSREVWGEDLSYLTSTEVKGEEDSPDTYWRATISRTTMSRALDAVGRGVGTIRAVRVVARSESGRVLRLRVEGSQGATMLSGSKLRSALGESTLKSTLFELSPRGRAFVFVGSGRGHGVGMSQWGAQGMARRGALYTEILQSFYPGTKLTQWGRHFGDAEEFAGR